MKRYKRKLFYCVCIGGGLTIGICMSLLVWKHEHWQSEQIQELKATNDYLEEKINQFTNYYAYETEYLPNSFNYFAVGNSLTLIPSWGRGICATEPDNDYYNLVIDYLEDRNSSVVAYPYNFAMWERAVENRDAMLELLNVYLKEDLDLVTVQLGENVFDTATYEEDLGTLVEYVKNRCPKAQIILIGDFWSCEKNEIRKKVALTYNIEFADLSEIIGNKAYWSETGTECYLSDGTKMIVSDIEASHPGNKGMKYIADRVIEKID